MIEIKKLPRSRIEISAKVEAESFNDTYQKTLSVFAKEAEWPGFRKGRVPEKIIVEKFGRQILDEAAKKAISDWYAKAAAENKIDALGSPEVIVEKLALGNPLLFKLIVSVLPDFELPDYRKIAARKNKEEKIPEDFEPTEKEIKDVLKYAKNSLKKDSSAGMPESAEESAELSDEDARKLGDFKDRTDFMTKLKHDLKEEKKYKHKERKRAEILEELVKETNIDLPEMIIESELDRMSAETKESVERMGFHYENYLKRAGKTEDGLRREQKESAAKRGKTQLILNKIALKENIKPDEAAVEREVQHLLCHYKKADPKKARIYAGTILLNEKVLEFLESIK